jgi:hypothetical protein
MAPDCDPNEPALAVRYEEVMTALESNTPRAGDVVVYKGATSDEKYLLSIFQRASQLAFCTREEAMRDAVAIATRDHVDAWYTEDGQAYERTANHRVQHRRTHAA